MVKEHLNVTLEAGLKEKAKAEGLNISETIESVVKDRIARKGKEEGLIILMIKPYGIILQPLNYVVAKLKNPDNEINKYHSKDFDQNSVTYHPNLHQALIQLSKRLMENGLKTACKDEPLNLKELALFIQDHHTWFIKLVKGM